MKNNPALLGKKSVIQEELNKLCDISADDAYEQIRSSRKKTWKVDWDYLENQRRDRTAHMGNIDQHSVVLKKGKKLDLKNTYEEVNVPMNPKPFDHTIQ